MEVFIRIIKNTLIYKTLFFSNSVDKKKFHTGLVHELQIGGLSIGYYARKL